MKISLLASSYCYPLTSLSGVGRADGYGLSFGVGFHFSYIFHLQASVHFFLSGTFGLSSKSSDAVSTWNAKSHKHCLCGSHSLSGPGGGVSRSFILSCSLSP